jgi:GNAT superfamily N-acetyltransferase
VTLALRDGTADDAGGLVPLFAALGYPVEPATLRARLGAMLADDRTARILLATNDGVNVGFACLHETPMPHRPTAVGRITAIAVLQDARGSGAGRLLVEAAEAHFVSRGIARIEVTSGDNHAAAHAFYLHLGYADNGVRFAKPLARQDPAAAAH